MPDSPSPRFCVSPLPDSPFSARTRTDVPSLRRQVIRGRRDRHGRGLRGPILPPYLPAWRTRAQLFDEAVARSAQELGQRCKAARDIQYAVEEVPPSDPAPWEHGIVLGRGFAAEPRAGLAARVVLYRQPITSRTCDDDELRELIHRVVVEQTALMLGRNPEDLL